MNRQGIQLWIVTLCLLVLMACPDQSTVEPPEIQTEVVVEQPSGLLVEEIPRHAFPTFTDMFDKASMIRALDNQIRWISQQPAGKTWHFGADAYSRDHMKATLQTFKQIWQAHDGQPETLRKAIGDQFRVYEVRFDGSTNILVTSYHAPIYKGSLQPSETYAYPIYARPKDLISIRPDLFPEKFLQRGSSLRGNKVMARFDRSTKQVVPYYSRTQIDQEGALKNRGLELCYLTDYLDQFLFHVQGGGFVSLPDGRFLRLNYAGKNGHPYRSIGRVLVDEGIIAKEDLNLPKVLEYLRSHPGEMERVCFMNESYVFYQADKTIYPSLSPEIFPHGVLDFPVTPKRSIATDKRHFPGGALCYVAGGKALVGQPAQKLAAFALDQDTGGAIVDGHIDFFAGAGPEAEALAGLMNDPTGRLYFLVLREATQSNN